MTATFTTPAPTLRTTADTPATRAAERFRAAEPRPALRCAWNRVLMIHYAIDPAILQPHVPFELDTFNGLAYVSLVAFEMAHIRTGILGPLLSRLPLFPAHRFLNLRTYVTHQGEPGIFFLAEWVSNALAVKLGPPLYGLPYRHGRICYNHGDAINFNLSGNLTPSPCTQGEASGNGDWPRAGSGLGDCPRRGRGEGLLTGTVESPNGGTFSYTATLPTPPTLTTCAPTTLDHFLMERYTAYTARDHTHRRFLVSHAPWPATRATVTIRTDTLLHHAAPTWWPHARLLHATYSPGLPEVSMSAPVRLTSSALPLPPGEGRGEGVTNAPVTHAPGRRSGGGTPRPGAARFSRLPLLLLPLVAIIVRPHLPPWLFMWLLACAIFFACKLLTLLDALPTHRRAPRLRLLAFLFLYPGMNARDFLDPARRVPAPALRDFLPPTVKLLAALPLLFLLASALAPHHPTAAAWTAMTSLILLLHFGSLHLLTLLCRALHLPATPLMNRPTRATSLADFWARRWNTAFHHLTGVYLFKPLARRTGPARATLLSFFLSGLLHDLVISLPARGGHGLPTLYFLLQGLGLLVERSPLGRRLRLTRGATGWTWTALLTLAPAPLLFHRPFVDTVIHPMLRALNVL